MDQTELTEAYRKEFRKIEIKRARGGFWSHLLIFSLTNLIIIIYNVVGHQTWFWYPLILWSIILIVHFFKSVVLISSSTKRKEQLALERLNFNSITSTTP